MGKRAARSANASTPIDTGAEVPVVGLREPCPCGSGRRYKACHGKEQAGANVASSRPFEGLASECDIVAPRMVHGGIIAFHDFRSQFIGVERCYNELLATGLFEEVVIPWKDIEAEVVAGNLEAGTDTYHHTELANPMFLGALRRK